MSLKIYRWKATVFTDTAFINRTFLAQNTCYQGYSAEKFIKIIPMRDRKDTPDSPMTFAHDVAALAELLPNHATMLIGPNASMQRKHASSISSSHFVNRILNVKMSLRVRQDF